MGLDIRIVFPDGQEHRYEVHEITIQDNSATIFTRNGQIVIKENEEDVKW